MASENNILIRRLASGDGPAYRKIRLAALQQAPEAFGSTYDTEAKRSSGHFEDRVTTGCIFGAFRDGDIIGMAGFYREQGAKLEHKGVLWGMYVDAQARYSGIGAALVSAVLEHAKDLVDLVHLSVVTENASGRAFYEKMGFKEYGREPRALKIGTRYFSETLMVCDLE